MNQTDLFIDYLLTYRKKKISDDVVHQVKRCLLDYLGVTFSGSKLLYDEINEILKFQSSSDNSVNAIGLNKKTNLYTATMLNGLNSHVAELDDGSRFGAIHAGSPIFSALLPLAQKERISGKIFIESVVVAYEAAILLASSIQPSHYNMGYHPTSTCGAIGAALGSGIILGFNRAHLKNSFSAACISASGTLKVIEDYSELKPYNAGNAALNGLVAAVFARNFSGPSDVLSGSTGFLNMMSETNTLEIPNSNSISLIKNIYFKPYAACRHAHPSIEAAMIILKTRNIDIDQIKKITIKTYKGVIGKHDSKHVSNINSAKMSIPFSVALTFFTGKAGIEEFTEDNIFNSSVLKLVEKIEIIADENFSKMVPKRRIAELEIKMENDDVFKERVDFPKGEPENPMSDKDLVEKFYDLAHYAGKTTTQSKQIESVIWNLETEMDRLFDLI